MLEELTAAEMRVRIGKADRDRAPSAGLGPIGALIEDAAAALGLRRVEIVGERRTEGPLQARIAIAWVARTELGTSFPKIARPLGRDHTTILTAVRRADALRRDSFTFRNLTDVLVERVRERSTLS